MSFDMLASLRQEAVDFFINEGVLTFGDFTLKSGRKSPYFFNTGSLCSGRQLAAMGKLYARMVANMPEFREATVVFGSAYKGIPIATATAIALQGTSHEEIRAVSDRKEAKTHGDTSAFLGVLKPGDRAVIVDDVITTGGTKIEAIEKLRAAGCEPIGLIIAFDRAEPVDGSGRTAREVFEAETGLTVHALASVHDIVAAHPHLGEKLQAHLASFNSEPAT
jgi:orotate phosphoribosyltransferase